MERHCFMKVRILWLIAFLLFTVQLSAQQKVTVKGKITDEHNEPVIGANIMEYLQLIIPQYFISNKSGIWSLSLIVHSKG